MSESLFMRKRAELIAQCPPVSRVPEEEAAGLPINVTRVGHGPRVVIVHGGVQGGLGGGPITFRKQHDLAEHGWELTLVDRPGFGRSPSRGVDDMEADAVWLADMLGDGAHLVGHSWGGAEALLAAARRPDAVRSLVLVEPALQVLALSDPMVQADPAAREHLMGLGKLMMMSATPREYGLAFARSLGTMSVDGNAPKLQSLMQDEARASGLGCSLLQARMASPDAMRTAVDTVTAAGIPVLIISGGWSAVFDTTGEVVSRLLHGRHVIVRSPNHFPQLENPLEFNRVVDEFMRGSEPAGRKAT